MIIGKTKYSIFKIPLLFLFCISNLFIILFLFAFSGNIFLEIYKWIQFLAIILLPLLLLSNFNKTIAFSFVNFFYFSYLVLVTYFLITHLKLDFAFLKRNFSDIDNILPQFIFPLLLIFIIALVNSVLIFKFKPKVKNNLLLLFLTLSIILLQFFSSPKLNNELIAFAKTIYRKDAVIDYYQNFYNQLVQQSISNKNNVITQAQKIDSSNLAAYLDNIIILHLESLNGYLVNEENTPNFMAIAREGVLFPYFYSNSIQTILAQENLFCSLSNSFDMNLVTADLDKKIICLPEIFKYLNYKTFFLKSYKLSFNKTGKFMNNLLFDEVHAEDIMEPDDPQYPWGYKEDIFYKRAFDYFKKNKKEHNFLYMEIGPTNHFPFYTPTGLDHIVPYKNPKTFRQRLINTTFLQDQYLEIAWKEINNIFPEKNYLLLVLGDHGWPANFHKNNTTNEKEAYEENFITSMVMVMGGEEEFRNKIIYTKYSQMDILPSILELFGINFPDSQFSRSFAKELNQEERQENKTLLIQPYADRYLNIIIDQLKYQYNSTEKNITLFDLKNDPNELKGQVIGSKEAENLGIIKKLLEN